MDSQILTSAFRYAARKESKGVVVVRNGYIVGEWYGGGWDEMSRQHGYSVTKSFTSALVGMLIDYTVFVNENQVASDFIQEWQNPAHSIVTIENLLSMNSGLYWDILTDVLLVLSRDQNSYAIGLPMQYLPRVTWVYSNSATQVISELILSATGSQAGVYALDRLKNVLGMWNATWETDRVHNTLTYAGIVASAREFAKFGYLYLREGIWEDQQILSEDWIVESTQPSQSLNPFYGYLW